MNGMAENKFSYQVVLGEPDQNVLDALLLLYNTLFEDAKLNFFVDRIRTKQDLIIALCYDAQTLIGFKLGYRYDDCTLYSWVGGVLPMHRKKGIAQKLMELQHTSAKNKGYQKIRTKSMNRFKPMMILNLKNGFDVIQIYTNDSGQTKIIFEKTL